ncbi:MAG: SDR family NAD(P)-dependent oxidoreductase, partial [Acidobacteria bacterium]|nr:SDR family NAD(P)-dependent oxidoreductase [Acidobacteriota bacterium]
MDHSAGTEEQKEYFIPGMIRGDIIFALGFTEPQAGADLAIHYRNSKDEAAALNDRITAAGRRSCLIRGDLADRNGPQQIIAPTAAALGGLDVLVNNASVFSAMALDQV